MKNTYERLHTTEATSGETVTAAKAFNSENAKGILGEKDPFISFLKGLRREECLHVDNLFLCMKEGLRMTNSLIGKYDKGGKLYYWIIFARSNANEGVKILDHEGLMQIVKLYRDGNIKIDFTLDELVDEALS